MCLITNSRGNSMIDRILFKIYCMISWSSVFSPIKRLVAKWACPYNAEEHFWHDGCPVCWRNHGVQL
jgi:hypothetical protein